MFPYNKFIIHSSCVEDISSFIKFLSIFILRYKRLKQFIMKSHRIHYFSTINQFQLPVHVEVYSTVVKTEFWP